MNDVETLFLTRLSRIVESCDGNSVSISNDIMLPGESAVAAIARHLTEALTPPLKDKKYDRELIGPYFRPNSPVAKSLD